MPTNIASTCSKKGLTKKRTDKDQDKSGPIPMRDVTRFWSAKRQIPVAKPLKSGPQNEQRISLKNPTNEHLRLALVVGTLLKSRLRRKNRSFFKNDKFSGILNTF